MTPLYKIVMIILCGVFLCPLAHAAKVSKKNAAPVVERLGAFGQWVVYQTQEQNAPLCFMRSQPQQHTKFKKKRGAVSLTIAMRPLENVMGEISYASGVTLRPGQPVSLTIDGAKNFRLFSTQWSAFAPDGRTDQYIVAAMKGGHQATIAAETATQQRIADQFSLAGVTAAWQIMQKACAIR